MTSDGRVLVFAIYGFGLGSVQARVRKVHAAFLIDDQMVGATERHSFETIGD